MSGELLPCPTCAATAKRVSIGNRDGSLVQVCCSAECGRLEWSEYAWNHHATLANAYREKCGQISAALAERDEEIKRLRKVVDAALELEYVLRTPEGRADVDSFTAQPIRLALADMGIDLLEDEEAGR